VWEHIWAAFLRSLDEQSFLGRMDWSQAFLDGTLVPAKERGQAVGLTRRGKSTKVMMVADGTGITLGTLVASAQKAEVKLAEPVLNSVRVPRSPVAVPGNGPSPWWRIKGMIAKPLGKDSGGEASAHASQNGEGSAPALGGNPTFRATATAGWWNAPLPGFVVIPAERERHVQPSSSSPVSSFACRPFRDDF